MYSFPIQQKATHREANLKILIVLSLPAVIFGSSTSIKAELDTTKVFIGDPISWRIVVKPSKNERVEFPELNIENDVIDIISSKQTLYSYTCF